MAVTFYIDGRKVGSKEAKACFMHFAHMHYGAYDGTDLEQAWKDKSKSEEARELIENTCECVLEVFIED